jgi:hypothetical protein
VSGADTAQNQPCIVDGPGELGFDGQLFEWRQPRAELKLHDVRGWGGTGGSVLPWWILHESRWTQAIAARGWFPAWMSQ